MLAAFGHDAFGAVHVDERERHERKPQRVGDRVDDRGERAVRFRGPLEHVAKPMHRAPWLVAVAVHQPVHGPLQHVAQRQRDERGRAGRQQLDPDPVFAPDERSERRGDDRIARQDPERDPP